VIDLGNVHIKPSESVCSLGVVIDNTLSFDAHVNSVCKAVNYHAKALRHIWKRVTTDVILTIVSTIVGTRLDYCNAILHGTNISNVQKLQRAQNSIALIVTDTRRSEHITPVLARLHWLKIAEKIEYKVALLTFKALTTGKPVYLSDQLQLCAPVSVAARVTGRIVSTSITIGRRSPVGLSTMLCLSSGIVCHTIDKTLTRGDQNTSHLYSLGCTGLK